MVGGKPYSKIESKLRSYLSGFCPTKIDWLPFSLCHILKKMKLLYPVKVCGYNINTHEWKIRECYII